MRAVDLEALEKLQAVSNTERAHAIRNYLYFPEEKNAKQVATALRERGLLVEDRLGADDVNWLVLVTIHMIPTESAISEMVEVLERLAIDDGGEHDGWEAEVVS